ncbi:family 10 glycosylhydrolase [candidate division KSB1 bacterium]|nr:family 10 glycosylhydrolase [candidate division KSB1 bacterium]
MKKLLLSIATIFLVPPLNAHIENIPPKREFRGAWIATVINLDWPSAPGLNPQSQRQELIRLLDELQAAGINAVIFQVRSECDAMYASTIEPWSYWLTGGQGRAPSPFYDPLQFAVQEAHKRGMELHAWLNPYRAAREIGSYTNAPNHVSVQHPDWLFRAGNTRVLDPGLPMVRAYVTSVVMDVVTRYDVDGVHFDDYFYPYPPDQITNQDDATFTNYSRGFTNRGDWRRDNVNLLINMIHDSIQVVKPYVKFGISPFGIWRNGVPTGITGLDAYNTIYCDALAWLQQQTIDYLTPQLYWPFGGGQDYGKLMPWWASQMNGRHLYVGQAAYRIPNWPANEMPRQIRLNRSNPNAQGSIFFRALFFRDNPRGFTDSLKTNLYRHFALAPSMNWKEAVPPNPPQNLRFERIAGTGAAGLRWDLPNMASDGDTASRYVVYRFDQPTIPPNALDDPSKIIAIAGERLSMPKTPPSATGSYYYVVTSLDRNSNESAASEALLILPPSAPLLAAPADGAVIDTAQVALRWFYPDNASSYSLQVALDSTFTTQLLVNETGIADTFTVVSGLEGQQTYYWRVQASNPSGASAFSRPGIFTTGFPAAVALVAPSNNVRDVPLRPTLSWRTAPGASSYHLQVASTSLFDSVSTVFDMAGIADTSYQISQLEGDKFYFWRARAKNAIGESNWSTTWRFRTVDVTAVAEATTTPPAQYQLYQNYPNPFNPMTTIVFDLPKPSTSHLVIFDALGREILTLVNAPLAAGRHTVQFDASPLPSGIYYYRLSFEGRVLTRRMTVLK